VKSKKEVEPVKQAQEVKVVVQEVVADKFLSGVYSKTWWVRADFRCPVCTKRHVTLSDGPGETTPDEITTTCKAAGEVLVVKPWSPIK
jgi:hypothetical protein